MVIIKLSWWYFWFTKTLVNQNTGTPKVHTPVYRKYRKI